MVLSLLSLHSNDTLAHAASHLGVSQTITVLLRALPYHASKGQMIIPAELTAKHALNQENIFRNLNSINNNAQKNLEDAVFEFATIANDHLITARDMFKEFGGKVPSRALPLFLSAV
jgi:NADH dehydrogenase [ubiquinone] 1 alpha subcomplex assembly factor 6